MWRRRGIGLPCVFSDASLLLLLQKKTPRRKNSTLPKAERERMDVDGVDMDIDIDATGVSVASTSDQVGEGMRAAHLVSGELTLEAGKTKLSLESAYMYPVHHRPGVPPPFPVPSSTNSNSNSNSTPSSSTSTSTSTQCTCLQANASDTKAKGEVLAGTMRLDTETQTTTPTTQASQTSPAQTTQTILTMLSNKPRPSLTNSSSPPKPHQPKRTRRPVCASTAHDYLSTKELPRRAPCPIMVRRGTLP
ncbi:hypothetical protein BDQ12DRAFT_160971 [Crucibulum laeve]|uniref:Uncharacterized protein n=1 Tax=Crucibulum laeve TaxID=68775 RepID=A0A5C3LX04_9AGAR|nr:hypothetical protein BDQ12DRAFT_160971 [Crucibulum laeve]